MPRAAAEASQDRLVRLAAGAVLVALAVLALYLGRPILVPFALALLLAFVLAPLVSVLGRFGVPRIPAVGFSVALTVILMGSIFAFIGMQLAHLAAEAPHYQSNLTAKIESIQGSVRRNSLLQSVTNVFNGLEKAMSESRPGGKGVDNPHATASNDHTRPIPVELRQPETPPIQIVENVFAPLLEPLVMIGLVLVFVIFMLIRKEDLRDRFIAVAGSRDLQRTTSAIVDGAERLSGYLVAQTAINASFGVFIGTGLWLIGVPNPALWGLIGAMARFVPYIGVPVAALLPMTLALAVDPGWTEVVFIGLLFLGTEILIGQAVEPWLYGHQVGLSAVAVILSALFWTWIWGPVGLLLSTPLTMCVVVIGKNVEHLRFLDTLLGNDSALSPPQSLYLRMLAGNPDEAAAQAELLLQEMSLSDYFDRIALRSLLLAQQDWDRGALDEAGAARVRESIDGLIANLSDFVQEGEGGNLGECVRRAGALCVAGRGELDMAAANLLAAMLRRKNISVKVASSERASSAHVASIDPSAIAVVCVSYLAAGGQKNARYLIRRLRRQIPDARIVAGLWGDVESDTQFLDLMEATSCDGLATDFHQACRQIQSAISAASNSRNEEGAECRPVETPGAASTDTVRPRVPIASGR